MHISDGQLRAYLDRQIDSRTSARVQSHLQGCPCCQSRLQTLAARSARLSSRLASLDPRPGEIPLSVHLGRARLQEQIQNKENETMINKIFSRRYRPAWTALAFVLILTVALAFPPVRTLASSFLGLFRVEQFAIVEVDPAQVEQLGSSTSLEELFAESVQTTIEGEPLIVGNAQQASDAAGFPVRLPTNIEDVPTLEVSPSGQVRIVVDLPRVRAILEEIGRSDIELPDDLDGAEVTVDIPHQVVATYGECVIDIEQAREQAYDPDDLAMTIPSCTTFVQMPSPTVTAPDGLDMNHLGEAFFQLLGMSEEDATRMSENIDWATTLVVPLPMYQTRYSEVPVDGATGTLIVDAWEDAPHQYLLMWVKEGIVYALSGPGNGATGVNIAESIE
ncbi:MAG: hypothetical protein JW726_04010 [Anaerolineales bacterium]|nr:hypothetical protein [Anaerolineales bacterium]